LQAPFENTKPTSDYKFFSKQRSKMLLNARLPGKPESLKQLFTVLFQSDPNRRPTIAEILKMKWMKDGEKD